MNLTLIIISLIPLLFGLLFIFIGIRAIKNPQLLYDSWWFNFRRGLGVARIEIKTGKLQTPRTLIQNEKVRRIKIIIFGWLYLILGTLFSVSAIGLLIYTIFYGPL